MKYEVRQFVRSVRGNRLETVFETDFERVAECSYADLVKAHPAEYFELVRVHHTEDCLRHNGTPE